jgi:hypothetical protein
MKLNSLFFVFPQIRKIFCVKNQSLFLGQSWNDVTFMSHVPKIMITFLGVFVRKSQGFRKQLRQEHSISSSEAVAAFFLFRVP